jgi:hypothetical protein
LCPARPGSLAKQISSVGIPGARGARPPRYIL